jgi:hypothetical protein
MALIFHAPFNDADNPLTIAVGTGSFTFTRATTALRYNGTKLISTATGTLRIEPSGALFEAARTNIMLYADTSADLLANWTSTGITATYDDDTNGYGDKRWTLAADGSDRQFVRTITIPASAHSLAFYVRKSGGSAVTSADCNIYADGANRTSTYTLVGNGIYRVEYANFTGANSALNSGLTVKASQTVYLVAPANLEAAAFTSSPIPTPAGSSVVRNADNLTFPVSGNITASHTIYVEHDESSTAAMAFHVFRQAGSVGYIWVRTWGSNGVYAIAGTSGSEVTTVVPNVVNTLYRTASAYNNTGPVHQAATNGTYTTAANRGTYTVGTGACGIGSSGSAEHLYGHVKNFRVYDTVFSQSELVDITTNGPLSVAITGTATASITETDVAAGDKTIIYTLTGDTWPPA